MSEYHTMLEGCRCGRCGHEWLPKEEREPERCPRCKSAYWNKAKKLHYDWHKTHKKLVKV